MNIFHTLSRLLFVSAVILVPGFVGHAIGFKKGIDFQKDLQADELKRLYKEVASLRVERFGHEETVRELEVFKKIERIWREQAMSLSEKLQKYEPFVPEKLDQKNGVGWPPAQQVGPMRGFGPFFQEALKKLQDANEKLEKVKE